MPRSFLVKRSNIMLTTATGGPTMILRWFLTILRLLRIHHPLQQQKRMRFSSYLCALLSITGELNKLISSDDTRFPKEVEKQSNGKWDSYLQKICSNGSRTFLTRGCLFQQ
ncbi:hypothetical protein CEXT_255771 [Caerostris extrusa]|uniref:Uncharacterized protein n=1 Tax=Caerostris extrusa TaxID=172846 RepID=A0AAV4WM75_CAEEX|nr:hypothetical protein CEXT_255771 [Caerostris extrusa]